MRDGKSVLVGSARLLEVCYFVVPMFSELVDCMDESAGRIIPGFALHRQFNCHSSRSAHRRPISPPAP